MLRQYIKLLKPSPSNNLSTFLRHQLCSTTSAPKEKWDLLSAVCIERHPLISKPKNEIEAAFQNLLTELENAKSMKCDHEIKVEMEQKQAEQLKKGLLAIDPDQVIVVSAHELEDAGKAELAAFKFASRTTEADMKNITSSLDRKLDKNLVLLVQHKIGANTFWLPPQGLREEGETMREAAERIVRNICGENLNIKIYGNAPIGYYQYIYPKGIREKNGSRGAKVFYYLGKYIDGEVSTTVKYQWLDREELTQNLPKPVLKTVSQFLVPEENITMSLK